MPPATWWLVHSKPLRPHTHAEYLLFMLVWWDSSELCMQKWALRNCGSSAEC